MLQIGEETTFSAIFRKDKVVKEGNWRVSVFSSTVNPDSFPEKMCQENGIGTKINFTAKGTFTPAYDNEFLDLTGEWQYSQKSKEFIFAIRLAVPNVPSEPDDVMSFLTNSTPGIGPKLGADIFAWCHGDLSIVAAQPEVAAATIKRLSERKARLLAANITEASASAKLARVLNTVVDAGIIHILVSNYGRDAYDVVTKTPYNTVKLIGFDAADSIALQMGGSPVAEGRICGALLASMEVLKRKNSAILVKTAEHNKFAMAMLDKRAPGCVSSEMMVKAVHKLIDDCVIKPTPSYRYLFEDWSMERELAQRVYNLGQDEATEEDAAKFCAAFDKWKEMNPSIHLHENQEKAVYGAANVFSVVTGGPGTGKTTVLKAIMDTYKILFPDSPITLMAPTGLAAKRMTESCERKARTIHKALNLTPAPTPSGFDDSRAEKINGGLIVIDEFSMVGIHLACFLLAAIEIRPDTRIVFVGDVDQLPPVSPGSVLEDLIKCQRVHVTRLTKNFRQASGSNIADIAVKINTGNAAAIKFGDDCIFTEAQTDENIRARVENEFLQSIQEFGLEQTYVLSPTHKSEKDILSSNSLNKRLQELVNPVAPQVEVGNWIFRVGDRVINKKNTEEVINGDIGVIKEIIPEDVGVSMRIDFSDGEVVMPPERLKNLELAYCITVHSSQGCEFKSVIMPISASHHFMLSRNLTYTAITRAKKKMHLIGVADELNASVMNVRTNAESDLLCKCIRSKKKIVSPTKWRKENIQKTSK